MHILEIPSFFTPYGGEFCLEQAKALQQRGHEVRILANVQLAVRNGLRHFFLQYPYGRRWESCDGVEVYRSYQRGIPLAVRMNYSRWVGAVRSMFQEYVSRYGKPDIIHAHCVKWAGYAAMLIGREEGLPYVITEHLPKEIYQVEFGAPPADKWQIPLLRQALHEAKTVITVSDELVDDLSCYFGRDYRHTTVNNIIDVDFFAYRERQPLAGRPFRFCCPALFVERKGYDILFCSFAIVAREHPEVELHVAGMNTASRECRALAKAAGCDKKVVFHGTLSKTGVREMLWNSDAMVLATRGESQGLVLLEAMSTGIPAISTEAIPVSVRPDCGHRYVPVGNAEALAREMLSAMEKPTNGRHLWHEQVSRMASPDAIAEKIEKVFKIALDSQ